jgi:adenylate cyclase
MGAAHHNELVGTLPTSAAWKDDGVSSRPEKLTEVLRRINAHPGLLAAARAARRRLPGDERYGDPLSVAGNDPTHLIGQRLAPRDDSPPSALRELGLSALQVWQAVSEAQGRGYGDREVAILFTDLCEFSDWALDAGDTMVLELLRAVGQAVEPAVAAHGGTVVKRLGDGLMAVFEEPGDAVEAALEASAALDDLEVGGHRPRLRAGVHVGRPRKLGGDYYGVDVNVAARLTEAAGAGEVLVSDAARTQLDEERLNLRRRRRFKAKGAPTELQVYAVESSPSG